MTSEDFWALARKAIGCTSLKRLKVAYCVMQKYSDVQILSVGFVEEANRILMTEWEQQLLWSFWTFFVWNEKVHCWIVLVRIATKGAPYWTKLIFIYMCVCVCIVCVRIKTLGMQLGKKERRFDEMEKSGERQFHSPQCLAVGDKLICRSFPGPVDLQGSNYQDKQLQSRWHCEQLATSYHNSVVVYTAYTVLRLKAVWWLMQRVFIKTQKHSHHRGQTESYKFLSMVLPSY